MGSSSTMSIPFEMGLNNGDSKRNQQRFILPALEQPDLQRPRPQRCDTAIRLIRCGAQRVQELVDLVTCSQTNRQF